MPSWMEIAQNAQQNQNREVSEFRKGASAAGVPGTGGEMLNWLHNVAGGAGAKPIYSPGSPGWYRDQQAGFKDNLQNPGLDNSLYNNAMRGAEQAQAQNAGDMQRYLQMAQGQGAQLGVQQVMRGQQQAANAQNALANSARGGIYNQAAMGQNAMDLNNQGQMQAQMQANKLREQNKVAGMGMYANAANVGRDASAGMLANAQTNAVTGASQQLGYQNLQDKSNLGLDQLALGTSRNNENRANSFYSNYQNMSNEQRQKELGIKASEREGFFAPSKMFAGGLTAVGSVIGKIGGGG